MRPIKKSRNLPIRLNKRRTVPIKRPAKGAK
ncbi:Uncharacterised protein [Vibrio cholerae]|nr:Uncharacterised protein [Vibrio cholerae]CSC73091.1 Uncharacterised protein [Vibrio cholerae]CSD38270.1 Uncharacterised protein [Vibrio cholerae]